MNSRPMDINNHPWVIAYREIVEPRQKKELETKMTELHHSKDCRVSPKPTLPQRYPLAELPNNTQTLARRQKPHSASAIKSNTEVSNSKRKESFNSRSVKLKVEANPGCLDEQKTTIFAAPEEATCRNGVKTHVGPWELGKTLGKGSTSRVRKARHRLTSQYAAIKIIPKEAALISHTESLQKLDASDAAQRQWYSMLIPPMIEREIAILKLTSHPAITRLYDVWENQSEM